MKHDWNGPRSTLPEAHLADERAVEQEGAEAVRGVELALALPRAAAGAERLAVDDGVARARLGQRLPPLEPVAAADADLAPGVVVAHLERPQHHPRARPGPSRDVLSSGEGYSLA